MVVTIYEGVLEPTQLCHEQHDDDDDDDDDTVSSEDGLKMSTSYSFTFLVPCPLCLRIAHNCEVLSPYPCRTGGGEHSTRILERVRERAE